MESAIKNSKLYKNATLFTLGLATSHCESFFNKLNIYRNKRSHYSDLMYLLRTNMAVLMWNDSIQPKIIAKKEKAVVKKRVKSQEEMEFAKQIWNKFCDHY